MQALGKPTFYDNAIKAHATKTIVSNQLSMTKTRSEIKLYLDTKIITSFVLRGKKGNLKKDLHFSKS